VIHPRELLKRVLPPPLRRAARFVYRLPVHYRSDQSYQICAEHSLGHGTIALSDQITIVLPDHAVAGSVFRSMAFEKGGREELNEFLSLAEGRERLVDLGASGGFFSALFARSRDRANVLSVEFDRASLPILEQTKARNQSANGTWIIDSRGIGDAAISVEAVSTGYGGAVSTEKDKVDAQRFAELNRRPFESYEVRLDLLANICRDHQFAPDIMKVDIEGFEYEMINSSMEFLGDLKPRLSFELHVAKMQRMGKNPEEMLRRLGSLGYRIARSGRPLEDMLRTVGGDGVSRAALSADSWATKN
jgi:FkbM family methyltransferase